MILCAGLSPTVQRTLRFRYFSVGQVNRAYEVHVTASGKAVNVARVVRLLGGSVHLVQPVAGDSGRALAQALDAQSIPHTSVLVENASPPTRTCTTILTDGAAPTEMVEEAPPLTRVDVARLQEAIRAQLPHASALCVSGSFPATVGEAFYADLAKAARRAGVDVYVDAQRAPLRRALQEQPFLVKPNLEEAVATLGLGRSGDDERDGRIAAEALRAAGARWAVVSLGSSGCVVAGPGEAWRVESPRVEALNPIGSGDSLMAGILYAHVTCGTSVPEAVVYGTACAAANCLTVTSGVVRPPDVAELLPQVRTTRLPSP